jgi:hypothetical protein
MTARVIRGVEEMEEIGYGRDWETGTGKGKGKGGIWTTKSKRGACVRGHDGGLEVRT